MIGGRAVCRPGGGVGTCVSGQACGWPVGEGGREGQWDGISVAAGSVSWEALLRCPVIGTRRQSRTSTHLCRAPDGPRPPAELPQLGQEGGEVKCRCSWFCFSFSSFSIIPTPRPSYCLLSPFSLIFLLTLF